MKLLRKILFPLVPIYYLVTWFRNKCYDWGLKSSKSYETPIICVGNLSTGGTGKTPMIEYLIRLLAEKHQVPLAVLSRGYGRKTKGFILAEDGVTAEIVGDEPFQFFNKFDAISVAVDENRQRGIDTLRQLKSPSVILLDDAFQHRKVKADLNVLLTAYGELYCNDIVLPTGNLREPKSGAQRADIIVVTKCPMLLSDTEKTKIIRNIQPAAHQSVYFSTISYAENVIFQNNQQPLSTLKKRSVTVVTGVANPKPFVDFLKSQGLDFEHINYKDHHLFSESEIALLKKKELILTTEKDFGRLKGWFTAASTDLCYLPITFKIDQHASFDAEIMEVLN